MNYFKLSRVRVCVCVCGHALSDVLCRLHTAPAKTVVGKLQGRIRHCSCRTCVGSLPVHHVTRLEIASAWKLSDRLKILLRHIGSLKEFTLKMRGTYTMFCV